MIEHNNDNTTNESDCDEQTGKQCVQRFKVVKLVSSQPYRVGRWLCVEYTDDDNSQMSDALPLSDDNSDTQCTANSAAVITTTTTGTATTTGNSTASIATDTQSHNNNNNNSNSNNNSELNTQSNTSTNDNNSDERLQSVEGVAIDNKIEQAMDLVKSHLMFAVREEVDVLRERITELNARVEQLEHENALLRAHVLPETLNLLQLN